MAIRILSDEQRARYGRFTGTPAPDTLARYFHLDTSDLDLIQGLRGEHNRLGFAVVLGTARCLGTFLDQEADIPGRVLHSLSRHARRLLCLAPTRTPSAADPPALWLQRIPR